MMGESKQPSGHTFHNITEPVQQPTVVPPLTSSSSKIGRGALERARLTTPCKSFGAVARLSEKSDELQCLRWKK